MPVILRVNGFKFWFYSADLGEPPHVHVGKDRNEAKFWLRPVALARSGGFRAPVLREIQSIVDNNVDFLLQAWEKEQKKRANR